MSTLTEGAVISAYHSLKRSDGAWVPLARLRDRLSHIPRRDLDKALSDLFMDKWIDLICEVNQKTLTTDDREAALYIVGDYKHLYKTR